MRYDFGMVKVLEKVKFVLNGGIEAYIFGMSENIDRNIKIDVFSDNAPKARKYIKIADKCGMNIFFGRGHSAKFKPFRMIAKWLDFFCFSRKNHYDIVHIHMCRPYDVLYAAAAKFGGGRIILHSHCSGCSERAFKRLLNDFFRALSRRIGNEFAACSEQAAEYMFGTKKFILLKNGIDTAAFAFDREIRKAERERLGIGDSLAVGNVGRLAPLKNHTFLLDVFAELLKICENSVLVIAGDGELSETLKQKAAALGILDKVIFLGDVDNASALYQALDCFVFPSLSEGLGIAAVEAQASGLVTVCSDGVPKEAAVTGLCSFMPPAASPKEWAEHIISQCTGYERRSCADEVRAAGYDIHDTAKQLEKIYLSEK